MYLFGGKFCKFTDETSGQERECTCPEIISKHPHCECDRKHFNNILWATVTVFQVSILTIHFSCSLAFFSVFFFSQPKQIQNNDYVSKQNKKKKRSAEKRGTKINNLR